jgi:hypothetical protein
MGALGREQRPQLSDVASRITVKRLNRRAVCGNIAIQEHRSPRTMKEIRLCWNPRENDAKSASSHETEDIAADRLAAPGSLWFPDTPLAREMARRVMAAGNAAHGPGTHWIVEREA